MRHVLPAIPRRAARLAVVGLLLAGPALAQKGVPATTVMVGGSAMVSDRDIMDDLPASSEHTVFVSLLQSAGMADMLRERGPFTVFAPTNAAFAVLPPGTLDALLRPDAKPKLVALLSNHIVSGNYSVARLQYLLRAGKGQSELETSAGGKVTLLTNGPSNLVLRDAKGGVARFLVYDVKQSNGVLFVIDRVLMPG